MSRDERKADRIDQISIAAMATAILAFGRMPMTTDAVDGAIRTAVLIYNRTGARLS